MTHDFKHPRVQPDIFGCALAPNHQSVVALRPGVVAFKVKLWPRFSL